MTLVVLGLASYRLTRLLVLDKILDGPRDWLLRSLAVGPDHGPRAKAWRTKVSILIQCVFCVGVYATLAVCAWWHWLPAARWLILVGAVIGAQALLSAWEPDE